MKPNYKGTFAQRYAFHRQHHSPFHAFMSAVAIGQLLLASCAIGLILGLVI